MQSPLTPHPKTQRSVLAGKIRYCAFWISSDLQNSQMFMFSRRISYHLPRAVWACTGQEVKGVPHFSVVKGILQNLNLLQSFWKILFPLIPAMISIKLVMVLVLSGCISDPITSVISILSKELSLLQSIYHFIWGLVHHTNQIIPSESPKRSYYSKKNYILFPTSVSLNQWKNI